MYEKRRQKWISQQLSINWWYRILDQKCYIAHILPKVTVNRLTPLKILIKW